MTGDALSRREYDVLAQYAATPSAIETAHALGISVNTVGNHMSNLQRKLRADSMVGAYVAIGWLRVPRHILAGGVDAARQTARGA